MALTRLDKTGDGTTTVYNVDFDLGFISRNHVYVHLASNPYNVQLSYTWVNNTQIQLTTPVANGVEFKIRRVVPRNNIVNDYESGAILREKELDNSFKQAIMILQEIEDGYIEVEGTFVIGGDLQADGEITDGTGNVLSEKMQKRPTAGQLNIVVFNEDGDSEDSGVNITGLTSGEGFAFTESKTLADGQVSVTFNTLDPLFARFVVCGDNVDNGALCAADYQTSAGSKTVTLTSSYPAGTVLMGIQNDQTADIETNVRHFTRPVTLAEAVANTNVQEGDTVIISDRGNGLFEYKTGQVANGHNIVSCTGVPTLSLTLVENLPTLVLTEAEALANKNAYEGLRVQITDRADAIFEYRTGLSPDGFSELSSTHPDLDLELVHEDIVYAKWFGAGNNVSKTANLQAFITYVGEHQLEGRLGQGGFFFNQTLFMHRNCNITGVGSSFGSTLFPFDNAQIVFRGDLETGGFVFHASLVNVGIDCQQSTLTNSEVIKLYDTFTIKLDVRIENMNTATNNVGILIERSNDIDIITPVVFGTSTSAGYGIHIKDNVTCKIYSPDTEVLYSGIVIEGNENTVVDVFGMYTERNIVGIQNLGGVTGGQLNIFGGDLTNASSSSVAAILNSKTRVYGTNIKLSGGQGFTTNAPTNPDVEFHGISQDIIAGDFFTGSNMSTIKNGVYRYENMICKRTHTDDTFIDLVTVENVNVDRPTIIDVDLFATSNGYGRGYKSYKVLVVKDAGGSYANSILYENDMTNSGSGNFNITVDLNITGGSNATTIQGKFTMTGALNGGNTADLTAIVKMCTPSDSTKMKTL